MWKDSCKNAKPQKQKQPGNTVTFSTGFPSEDTRPGRRLQETNKPQNRAQQQQQHNNSNNTTTATTQHGGRKTAHFGENSSDTHAQWFLFSLKRTVASILVFLKVGQHPEPNTKVQGPGSCGPASAFIQKGPRNFPGQSAQCTPCQGH